MEQVSSENLQPSTSPSPDFDAIIKKYHKPQSKKWLLGLFIVGIVLGVIGYFWYQDYQKAQSQIQEIINTVIYTSPTPAPDPTANWETYTNTRYGYSLKYPPNWAVKIRCQGGTPDDDYFCLLSPDLEEDLAGYLLKGGRVILSINDGKNAPIQPNCPENINGYKFLCSEIRAGELKGWISVIPESSEEIPTYPFQQNTMYFTSNITGGKQFLFRADYNKESRSTTQSIFDQILSTFKFLGQDKYSSDCCSEEQLEAGYTCVQDCGPPVMREGDIVTYSCLAPEEQNRSCPICLSQGTRIATPNGEINVEDIRVDQLVWTLDKNGKKLTAPVIRVSNTLTPKNHQIIHLVLKDKRELWVSPNHPTINEKTVGDLQVGESYDGSTVVQTELIPYQYQKTYDLLPAGQSGFYFANSILVASSLKK